MNDLRIGLVVGLLFAAMVRTIMFFATRNAYYAVRAAIGLLIAAAIIANWERDKE